eukprot:Hpha_TRINITY_DN3495_c0_g1::TRINITY_DN3495_c0_g1_i1::g.32676::m.32676
MAEQSGAGSKSLSKGPQRPPTKCKPCRESVTALFRRWCEYYYHLKRVRGSEDDLKAAAVQMQELAGHSCLKEADIRDLEYQQAAVRAKFFPSATKTPEGAAQRRTAGDAPAANSAKRRCVWNGSKMEIVNGETDLPEVDRSRVPF